MKQISVEKPRKQKLILVGNGMSGFKFCEKYLKYGVNSRFDLVVFGEENYPAYDRVNLSRYFTDPVVENLFLAPASWYPDNGIILHIGEKVTEINRTEKWIRTDKGTREKYDKLILATGSAPFVPPIEGTDLHGVFVFRSIPDLDAILKHSKQSGKAVVIGGGILGLEAARTLKKTGLEVTVIEKNSHIMHKQLDENGAEILTKTIESVGLKVLLEKEIASILGNGNVNGVELKDGTILEADSVVIIAGIKPKDELAKTSGIEVAEAGGIRVNNFGLTNDANIYAIGECVNSYSRKWGLTLPCYEMAEVLAARLGGIFKAFLGEELFTQIKFPEVKLVCFGSSLINNEQTRVFTFIDNQKGIYKRINVSADEKTLLGGILIGETAEFSSLFQLFRNKTILDSNLESLIDGSNSQSAKSILDWPDSTKICICEGVSKGTILSALRNEKLNRIDQIKTSTRAGTACESCTSVLEELLEAYLENSH